MLDLDVIDRPDAAMVALDPVKARILAALATPGSAASLAAQVGLTRQKVNYHLGVLERHKLVEPAGDKRWGGLTERLMVATARSYIVSPAALGAIAVDPARNNDRLSASYLIALAARTVREVGKLWRGARTSDKRLATLSIDTVISFASPADRAAFSADLADALATLAARYHDERPGARPHRLVVASYPAPDPAPNSAGDPARDSAHATGDN
ncbi:ArsR/SmtB family transcription factor [Sphingomonas sp.]|uniref:ArsR/SmtB family transcription factor n=1 Tax=Sphingomonas sp. TaxID=28214 RepID=UPI003D6D7B26